MSPFIKKGFLSCLSINILSIVDLQISINYSFYSQGACNLDGQIRHKQETIKGHSSICDVQLYDTGREECSLSITVSESEGGRGCHGPESSDPGIW